MGASYRRTNRSATLATKNAASRIIAPMTITVEMPYEVTAAKIALAPASLGNVRTETRSQSLLLAMLDMEPNWEFGGR